jgi:hypothetical protein
MLNLNLLAVAFTSLLGDVDSMDISKSFSLMGKGMLGIFIVMLLIFLVIAVLNKATGGQKGEEDNIN